MCQGKDFQKVSEGDKSDSQAKTTLGWKVKNVSECIYITKTEQIEQIHIQTGENEQASLENLG